MLSAAERIAHLVINDPVRKLYLLGIALGTDIDGICRNNKLASHITELYWEDNLHLMNTLNNEELCEWLDGMPGVSDDDQDACRLNWANLEARYSPTNPYRKQL